MKLSKATTLATLAVGAMIMTGYYWPFDNQTSSTPKVEPCPSSNPECLVRMETTQIPYGSLTQPVVPEYVSAVVRNVINGTRCYTVKCPPYPMPKNPEHLLQYVLKCHDKTGMLALFKSVKVYPQTILNIEEAPEEVITPPPDPSISAPSPSSSSLEDEGLESHYTDLDGP